MKITIFALVVLVSVLSKTVYSDEPLSPNFSRILDGSTLRLKSGEGSAVPDFSFFLEVFVNREGKLMRSMDIIVQHLNGRSAVMVRYGDGTPYCLLTQDLAIRVDDGGVFHVIRKGSPQFYLGSKDGKGTLMAISQGHDAKWASVNLDLRSLVERKDLTEKSFDDLGNRFNAKSSSGIAVIQFVHSIPIMKLPVERILLSDVKGNILLISGFTFGNQQPINITKIEQINIEKAGVPTVEDDENSAKAATPFPSTVTPTDKARSAGIRLGAIVSARESEHR